MSIYDDIPVSKAPASGGSPAPAKSIYDDLPQKQATPTPTPKKSIYDDIPTTRAPASPSPYFYGTTPGGGTIGKSDELDSMGKPFLGYRNPGDTATTTDRTRVATPFDPRVAQKLDHATFKNGRDPAVTKLRAAMGTSYNQELDHKIALELSGSNDKSNLGPETAKNPFKAYGPGNPTPTDALENKLAHEVASGQKSLFQAQTELSKAKNLPTPWTADASHPANTTPLPGIGKSFTPDQKEQYGTIAPPEGAKAGDTFKVGDRTYQVRAPTTDDIAKGLYEGINPPKLIAAPASDTKTSTASTINTADMGNSGLGDFVKSILNPQVIRDTVTGLPQAFADVVGKPQLRAYAAVGSYIAKRLGLSNQDYAPEGKFLTELYGTDKPLSISSVGQQARPFGPAESTGAFKYIDPTVGFLIGSLDAVDGGVLGELSRTLTLSRSAREIIAASKDTEEIASTLRKEIPELSEGLSYAMAKPLVHIEDVKDVDTILNRTKVELQRLNNEKATADAMKEPLQLKGEVAAPEQAVQKFSDLPASKTPLTKFDTPEILAARASASNATQTHSISTDDRVQLRQDVANKIYGTGAANKNKRLDIVMGLPASGKTSIMVEPLAKEHGSLVADADIAKKMLPEYGKGEGAGIVHIESARINKQVLDRSLKNGDNVVYPTLGKNLDALHTVVDQAKANGYDVHVHNMEISPEESAGRAVNRYVNEGSHFVDPHFILHEVGLRPKQNFDIIKNDERITSYKHYSNEVPRGENPKLIGASGSSDQRSNPSRTELPRSVNTGNDRSGNRKVLTIPPEPLINQTHVDELHALDQEHQRLALKKEEIANHPAASVLKYVNPKTGELPEALGTGRSRFGKVGDQLAQDLGYTDSEALRKDAQDLLKTKKQFQTDKKALAERKKALLESFKEDKAANGPTGRTHLFDADITAANHGIIPPVARGGITPPEVEWGKFKDKGVFRLERETMERNLEKVAPRGDAEKLTDFYTSKVHANETDRVVWANKEKIEIATKMKEFGLKYGTREAALIMHLGEGKISISEVKQATPKWQEVNKAVDYLSKKYDSYLEKWNGYRKPFGYDNVPKLKNYFRHFQDIDWMTKNYGFIYKSANLPTSIAGDSQFFTPGKPFSTAELKRLGTGTKFDAIKGVNNYIDSVSRQMFHIDSLQRGRVLDKYLKQTAQASEKAGQPLHLQNFRRNLQEYTNAQVSGKMGRMDRLIEESVVGRPAINAINKLSNILGKNIIFYNLSAALSHMVSIPLNIGTVDMLPMTHAMLDTLSWPFQGHNLNVIDGQISGFITRRYPVQAIQSTIPQKIDATGRALMDFFDRIKVRMAVASKYYEGINHGLDPKTAMEKADIYAGRIVGDYSIGGRPNLMNNKTMGILAQFQLGMNDGLSVLLHDIPYENKEHLSKMIWLYVKWALAAFALNEAYKKIKGSGKGLDPIHWIGTALGWTDDGTGKGFVDRAKTVGGDILGELPFTSMVSGNFPFAQAMKDVGTVATGAAGWKSKLTNIIAEFASPIGGGVQAKKTIQGIRSVNQGYTTDAQGNPTSKIDKSAANYAEGALFGKSDFQAPAKNTDMQTFFKTIESPYAKLLDERAKGLDTSTEEATLQQKITDAKLDETQTAELQKVISAYKATRTKSIDKAMMPLASKIIQSLKDDPSKVSANKLVQDAHLTEEEGAALQRVYDKLKKLP